MLHRAARGVRRLFTSPFTLPVHEVARKEVVPFSADQLFAVIADVDAYAKFLPFCTASRVVGRHGPESFDAELGIGFLAFDERYVSRVTLERPRAVSAVATNSGPFAHCRTAWRLRDADAASALISASAAVPVTATDVLRHLEPRPPEDGGLVARRRLPRRFSSWLLHRARIIQTLVDSPAGGRMVRLD